MKKGMSEAGVASRILLGAHKVASKLFRTNSGKAWMSNLGPSGVKRLDDGSVLIIAPRAIGLGMCLANGDSAPGQSDHHGWTVKTIPPEWVGRRVAIITAVEDKREHGGRVSDEQRRHIALIHNDGGIAVVANTPEIALDYIANWAPPSVHNQSPN